MIVIIGSGAAGLSAALAAAGDLRIGSEGLAGSGAAGPDSLPSGPKVDDVLLVTKTAFMESNTYHAQGGIAAAIFDDDGPDLHAQDTLAAGDGLCDPKAVSILTQEGASRVREFANAGVRFDRGQDGHILRGLEAAHSRARVVHAGGDATGKVLEIDVAEMVRENPRITVMEHAFLKDIVLRDGRVAGVRLLVNDDAGNEANTDSNTANADANAAESTQPTERVIEATKVILATGGAGRLYPYTTNPAVATGDGLAAALRAGAEVADLEFYQFHPTALAVGEHFLVSEAVRGEGAVLLDEHGERYMTKVDPRAELAPRDVVARANFRTMQAQGGRPVMLDVSPMRREHPDLATFLAHRFPTIDAYTRSLGFDWSKEPIPVAPAAHYWMGGIRTDLFGRTSIPGLYAAGECARTGVQGANRLASNSLLEGLVYGRRAGLAAVRDDLTRGWAFAPEPFRNSAIPGMPVCQQPMTLQTPTVREGDTATPWDRDAIERMMWKGVGLIRDDGTLDATVRDLAEGLAAANLAESRRRDRGDVADVTTLENRNLLAIGYVQAVAAINRCESRGAHTRSDFPQINPSLAHSVAYRLQ
ncbi:L-aspartate oxidase [Bifidobacterium simiarum]|uniref:L-aspartate oxidase n=1 Tax=Bifidobacterium simiarum TaxID=2045441 RepID=A0A2M9HF02_9BIFI|nr:FAD-binding protein [Bifidobacterium simiarum]PJM75376.1 L-aspartate oxidase [Bifidobacterium simiarum]